MTSKKTAKKEQPPKAHAKEKGKKKAQSREFKVTVSQIADCRRLGKGKEPKEAADALVASENPEIQALLAAYDGTPKQLVAEISKMKGPTTNSSIAKLNLAFKDQEEVDKAIHGLKHGAKPDKPKQKKNKGGAKGKKGGAKAKKDGKAKKDAETPQNGKGKKDAAIPAGVEVKLVKPTLVSCPDTDKDGNETVLVMHKDGLFGCGVIKPK